MRYRAAILSPSEDRQEPGEPDVPLYTVHVARVPCVLDRLTNVSRRAANDRGILAKLSLSLDGLLRPFRANCSHVFGTRLKFLSRLSPKRDCGPKMVEPNIVGISL